MKAVIALWIAALVASAAHAADQSRRISFAELDLNRDGRVSVTEANASSKLNRAFPTVDRDRDDYVSEQEFQSWVQEQAGAKPQQLVAPGEVTDEGSIEAPRIQRW